MDTQTGDEQLQTTNKRVLLPQAKRLRSCSFLNTKPDTIHRKHHSSFIGPKLDKIEHISHKQKKEMDDSDETE